MAVKHGQSLVRGLMSGTAALWTATDSKPEVHGFIIGTPPMSGFKVGSSAVRSILPTDSEVEDVAFPVVEDVKLENPLELHSEPSLANCSVSLAVKVAQLLV